MFSTQPVSNGFATDTDSCALRATQTIRVAVKIVLFVTLLLAMLSAGVAHAREKTDRIKLKNGDMITGEIKSVSQGLVVLSTTAMSTINLEWKHIASIDSTFVFQLELADGRILTGTLVTLEDAPDMLKIESELVKRDDVVRLAPIETRLLDRFIGSASVGLSYTKSSDSLQTNGALDATYRGERIHSNFSFSSISVDDSTGTHDRVDSSLSVRRLRPNRWYGAAIAQAQRNEELGIDLRVSAGGGYGRYLRQAPDREITITGGAIATREWLIGSEPNETEIEGLLEFSANYYVYDSPKVSFSSQLLIYPGFTDWGRVRSDLDLRVRWELISDLFFQLQLYSSYDNKPPVTEDTTTFDYGVVTSLSYDF